MRAEKHQPRVKPWLTAKRIGGVVTTCALATAFVGAGSLAANAAPDDIAEAEGRFLTFDGSLADTVNALAELAPAYSASPSSPGANSRSLDLELLSALDIQLGDGIQLFGENPVLGLGALGQFANAGETSAYASSGLIGEEGAISPATGTDPAENAYLDLAPILGAAGLDALLNQARLELGAISASASIAEDGVPEGDYQIAGGTLILQSQAIGDLSAGVLGALDQISDPINGLAGPGGVIENTVDPLLGGLTGVLDGVLALVGGSVDLGVTANVEVDLAAAVQAVLAEPLTSEDSVLTIDLSQGTISVDIARLIADTQGGDYDGTLNGLPANTELLDPDLVQAALDGALGTTLDQVPALLVNAVTDALNAVDVNIAIAGDVDGPLGVNLGQINVQLTGALGDFIGVEGSSEPVVTTDGTSVAGLPIGQLLEPLLQGITNTILPALVTPLSQAITNEGALDTIFRPIVETANSVLQPLFGLVTDNLLSLTANVQEVGEFTHEQATTTEDTFTERALEVTLLPNAPILQLALGSATVRGDFEDVVYTTVLNVDPSSVEPGATTTISGEGFAPGETVTIVIDGETVADDVVVLDDGTFSYDYTVPADTAAADYTVVATGNESNTPAEDTLTVTATSGTDADADSTANAEVNTNAAASASASADADGNNNAAAQAASEAAALADASTAATAASNADATAAAESAATADASSAATADVSTEANASSQAASQAAAQADNTSDTNAEGSAEADGSTDSAAASEAAATATSSADASAAAAANADGTSDGSETTADATADVNANAAASASASANADDDSNAAAQVAAQAAAQADATSAASAAADADATAAAQAAATADASTNASADVDSDVTASAQAAAQAAAQADATSTSNADATSAANANASAAASAASTADSSSEASANAAADVDGSETDSATTTDANATADVDGSETDSASTTDTNAAADADGSDDNSDENTNASASASASANADDDSNAAAQVAAQAAAQADATSAASAAANADATSAAASAANADASSDASTDVTSEANASAQAASQAAAQADASSTSNADASSAAEGNAAAAASSASNADSSSTASSAAAANASSDADGSDSSESDSDAGAAASANANASSSANANASSSSNANASADADGQELSIDVEKPRLQVGEEQTVVGHGFEAGEKVAAVQHSTPFEIGTAVADENGDVTFTWAVPASTELGNHSVELTGATSGSISGTFEVYENKGGGLSPTGGDMALPLGGAAALLMLTGAGVWFATSRRRARS